MRVSFVFLLSLYSFCKHFKKRHAVNIFKIHALLKKHTYFFVFLAYHVHYVFSNQIIPKNHNIA